MDIRHRKEDELMDVLSYAGCTKLPRAMDMANPHKKIWILAIAKVTKVDGSWSYAILKNDFGKRPKMTKIFGNIAAVSSIKSIHPYMWLNMQLVPKFKDENERIIFLSEIYGQKDNERIKSLSTEDRDRLLYSYCMEQQLLNDNNNNTAR